MKKLLACLLAACLCAMGAIAQEATPTQATPVEALGDGEMYFHNYFSSFGGYAVGVPAQWALIGAESPLEYITQASEIMDAAVVNEIRKGLSAENDILIAVSAADEAMVLTYGSAEGADNADLVDELDAFKQEMMANYVGITFTDDSGAYKLNELTSVLYIGAKYQSHALRQYYVVAGANLFVFTFTDVEKEIAEAVLSTFTLK